MAAQHGLGDTPLVAVLLVTFSPRLGPTVEHCFPEDLRGKVRETRTLPAAWSALPFIALPDASRTRTEDLVYFRLPPDRPGLPFLTAASRVLVVNAAPSDTPPAIGHRALVAVSRVPLFGIVGEKLVPGMTALFANNDTSKLAQLEELYYSIEQALDMWLRHPEYSLLDWRLELLPLLPAFNFHLLQLFKALLLNLKILVYSSNGAYNSARFVSGSVLALASLVPGLTSGAFGDANYHSPDTHDAYLQPLIAVQNIATLTSLPAFFAGTTSANLARRDNFCHVLVDLSTGTLVPSSSSVKDMLTLTIQDLRFADALLSSKTPLSDDDIRRAMQLYLGNLVGAARSATSAAAAAALPLLSSPARGLAVVATPVSPAPPPAFDISGAPETPGAAATAAAAKNRTPGVLPAVARTSPTALSLLRASAALDEFGAAFVAAWQTTPSGQALVIGPDLPNWCTRSGRSHPNTGSFFISDMRVKAAYHIRRKSGGGAPAAAPAVAVAPGFLASNNSSSGLGLTAVPSAGSNPLPGVSASAPSSPSTGGMFRFLSQGISNFWRNLDGPPASDDSPDDLPSGPTF